MRLEVDLMRQGALRHYPSSAEEGGPVQLPTTETSGVLFAEYTFPKDRFLLGAKLDLSQRILAQTQRLVSNQQTISMQLRYRLAPIYGVSLHASCAYRINETPDPYTYLFSNGNQMMFSTGLVWDFTLRK
jgi:hypothetical protein